MIEKKILDWLSSALPVPVRMERPVSIPESYVIIEKTGSSMNNWIYSVTIAAQSYAKTMYAAAELNEQVKAAMFGLLQHDAVSSVKLNSDYNYTDTSTKEYRYQAVFDLVVYDD